MTSSAPTFKVAGHVVTGARASADGHTMVVTKPSQFGGFTWLAKITAGGILLAAACTLLAGLALAMGITSFHAQFGFIFATKHERVPAMLEALGLDTGAVIFSLLGIALARLGRRAAIERVLVCACALGSCGMNILSANLGSPRSVAVWGLPPVLFALTSDRLVAVVRQSALGRMADDAQRSAWLTAGVALLYVLRFILAPPSTARGARQALLNATPLPSLPEASQTQIPEALPPPTVGNDGRRQLLRPTKTQRLIEIASERHDLSTIDVTRVSKIATELAPEADLHPASARRDLKRYVVELQGVAR